MSPDGQFSRSGTTEKSSLTSHSSKVSLIEEESREAGLAMKERLRIPNGEEEVRERYN